MSQPDSATPFIAALRAREASNNERIAEMQARIDELLKDNQRIADTFFLLNEVNVSVPAKDGGTVPAIPTTVPEMISRVLKDAGPMTAALIIGTIKSQWKPDIDPNNVRPVLWRLANEKRLKKNGELYELP